MTAETAAERQGSARSKLHHRARHSRRSLRLAAAGNVASIQSTHQSSNSHHTRLVPSGSSHSVSDSSLEPRPTHLFTMNHFPHGWGRVSSSLLPCTCCFHTDRPFSLETMSTALTTTRTLAPKITQVPSNILSRPLSLVLRSSVSNTRTVLSSPPTT